MWDDALRLYLRRTEFKELLKTAADVVQERRVLHKRGW